MILFHNTDKRFPLLDPAMCKGYVLWLTADGEMPPASNGKDIQHEVCVDDGDDQLSRDNSPELDGAMGWYRYMRPLAPSRVRQWNGANDAWSEWEPPPVP